MKYAITVKGRRRLFSTLEAAIKRANEIFARTGIIVGIEAA